MDAGERALLGATVRDALARVARDPSPKPDDALAALGWLEMLDAEPRDAIDIVFTALGTTNASATVLDDVIVATLGAEPRADLAVLLPAFATWNPPGRTDHGQVRGGRARERAHHDRHGTAGRDDWRRSNCTRSRCRST